MLNVLSFFILSLNNEPDPLSGKSQPVNLKNYSLKFLSYIFGAILTYLLIVYAFSRITGVGIGEGIISGNYKVTKLPHTINDILFVFKNTTRFLLTWLLADQYLIGIYVKLIYLLVYCIGTTILIFKYEVASRLLFFCIVVALFYTPFGLGLVTVAPKSLNIYRYTAMVSLPLLPAFFSGVIANTIGKYPTLLKVPIYLILMSTIVISVFNNLNAQTKLKEMNSNDMEFASEVIAFINDKTDSDHVRLCLVIRKANGHRSVKINKRNKTNQNRSIGNIDSVFSMPLRWNSTSIMKCGIIGIKNCQHGRLFEALSILKPAKKISRIMPAELNKNEKKLVNQIMTNMDKGEVRIESLSNTLFVIAINKK